MWSGEVVSIFSLNIYCFFGWLAESTLQWSGNGGWLVLCASDITVNLYRNYVYLYWEGSVIFSVYLRTNIWNAQIYGVPDMPVEHQLVPPARGTFGYGTFGHDIMVMVLLDMIFLDMVLFDIVLFDMIL